MSFHWRGWQQFLLWTKIRFPVQFTSAVFRYIDTDELKKLWPCEAPFCHKAKHPLPPLEQSDTMDGCMEGRMDGLMDNWLRALYSSWYKEYIDMQPYLGHIYLQQCAASPCSPQQASLIYQLHSYKLIDFINSLTWRSKQVVFFVCFFLPLNTCSFVVTLCVFHLMLSTTLISEKISVDLKNKSS